MITKNAPVNLKKCTREHKKKSYHLITYLAEKRMTGLVNTYSNKRTIKIVPVNKTKYTSENKKCTREQKQMYL